MATTLKTGRTPDRRTRFILMVLATLACGGFFLLGVIGALFSPLVFDERGNLFNPLAWLAFVLMIAFWIVCVVAPYVAWILWRRNRETQAWAVMSIPLLWGFATIIVLQFVPS